MMHHTTPSSHSNRRTKKKTRVILLDIPMTTPNTTITTTTATTTTHLLGRLRGHSHSTLDITLQTTIITAFSKTVAKTYSNRTQESGTKQRRTPSVVIRYGSPLSDLVDAPDIQASTITQCQACDDGESPGSRKGKAVTKVE